MRFMIPAVIFLVILNFFCHRAGAADAAASSSGNKDGFQPGKLFANVLIATNSVEQGITQTESSPAVQTMLGYKWEQFRAGIWGSNVRFTGIDDSINLRLFGAYRFVFTSNADLTIRADLNRYFSAGSRDGMLVSVDLNLFNYHVLYDKIDNWEATLSEGTRYGFFKEFTLPLEILLGTGAGYNMVSAEGYSNFFDLRLSLGYNLAGLRYELIGTYNSGTSQFGSRAGPFLFVNFSASF